MSPCALVQAPGVDAGLSLGPGPTTRGPQAAGRRDSQPLGVGEVPPPEQGSGPGPAWAALAAGPRVGSRGDLLDVLGWPLRGGSTG